MAGNILCFVAAALIVVEIDLAGGFFLAEAVLPISALLFWAFNREKVSNRYFASIVYFGTLYLFAQILSDWINNSVYDDYIRGIARILVFLFCVISIHVLTSGSRSRVIFFVCGFTLGRFGLAFVENLQGVIDWKLGLAKPAALALMLLLVALPHSTRQRSLVPAVAIIAMGLYNIISDFRSFGAVLIIAGLFLGSSSLWRPRRTLESKRQLQVAGLVAFILVAGSFAAGQFYIYAAESGWMSDRATVKYQMQAQSSELPLLIAGRNEILVSLEAIWDSPLFGHGSWPEDREYADLLALRRYQLGLTNSNAPPESDLIPSHSHIFGAWVEAGLAGAAFWALILFLASHALIKSYYCDSRLKPLYACTIALLFWDILFSPFGGFRRIETALAIVIMARALLQDMPSRSAFRRKHSHRRRRGIAPEALRPVTAKTDEAFPDTLAEPEPLPSLREARPVSTNA